MPVALFVMSAAVTSRLPLTTEYERLEELRLTLHGASRWPTLPSRPRRPSASRGSSSTTASQSRSSPSPSSSAGLEFLTWNYYTFYLVDLHYPGVFGHQEFRTKGLSWVGMGIWVWEIGCCYLIASPASFSHFSKNLERKIQQ